MEKPPLTCPSWRHAAVGQATRIGRARAVKEAAEGRPSARRERFAPAAVVNLPWFTVPCARGKPLHGNCRGTASTTLPKPLMPPERTWLPARSKTSVPLFATLPGTIPVAPPFPKAKMPAEAIVPPLSVSLAVGGRVRAELLRQPAPPLTRPLTVSVLRVVDSHVRAAVQDQRQGNRVAAVEDAEGGIGVGRFQRNCRGPAERSELAFVELQSSRSHGHVDRDRPRRVVALPKSTGVQYRLGTVVFQLPGPDQLPSASTLQLATGSGVRR